MAVAEMQQEQSKISSMAAAGSSIVNTTSHSNSVTDVVVTISLVGRPGGPRQVDALVVVSESTDVHLLCEAKDLSGTQTVDKRIGNILKSVWPLHDQRSLGMTVKMAIDLLGLLTLGKKKGSEL